jgi:hypothetical protein
MKHPSSWWIEELGRYDYKVGEPLGGTFPVGFSTFFRAAGVFAFSLSAVPLSMVLCGASPIGLIGALFPLPFAWVAWSHANSLANPVRVTAEGLERADGTRIPWDRVRSVRIARREISVIWTDVNGTVERLVRPRRRDVGDSRIETATLPEPSRSSRPTA